MQVSLPIHRITPETPLYRVHQSTNGPVFYGPGEGNPPANRFDSATGAFGVLYLGLSRGAAIVETLLRNPARRMIAIPEIENRTITTLKANQPLNLVALYGEGLLKVGTDNPLSTGPYTPCGLWADALWHHPDAPDGLAYLSRHDPSAICVALFQKPDIHLSATHCQPMHHSLRDVAAILDRYGKSIAPREPS